MKLFFLLAIFLGLSEAQRTTHRANETTQWSTRSAYRNARQAGPFIPPQPTISCNFDVGNCGFKILKLLPSIPGLPNYKPAWVVGNGPHLPGTGPNGDHTSGAGKYVYVKAAGKDKATAKFSSPTVRGDICVSFYYHMNGPTPACKCQGICPPIKPPPVTTPAPNTATTPTTTQASKHGKAACKDKFRAFLGHSACSTPSADALPCSRGVSETEKEVIVSEHNKYRGQVSPPAADMQKMVWDDELAQVAQAWASTCSMTSDLPGNRNIPGRFSVGQRSAIGSRSWQATIGGWFRTNRTFKQMVKADSARAGCGFADCRGYGTFFICNYANRIALGNPAYLSGNKSCEACPGRCTDNLCDCGGKVCENGGKLNLTTCQCTCPDAATNPFLHPGHCALDCSKATDHWTCGALFQRSHCANHPNFVYICPTLCGLCPWSGFRYVEGSVALPTGATPVNTVPAVVVG